MEDDLLSSSSAPDDHIQVVCRVRPPSQREAEMALGLRKCVTVIDRSAVQLNTKPQPTCFTFDHAVPEEGTQEEIFTLVGRPITDRCLEGYNGTIFAYGQTGSGKTFTTFGPSAFLQNENDLSEGEMHNLRGLVPRVLEYLFRNIARLEHEGAGRVRFLCKCSFYEIFNEKVYDLLDIASSGGLQVREKIGRVYVEGLNEEVVASPEEARGILVRGYRARHVGETAMNRESSRSHAVFLLNIEAIEELGDGLRRSRTAQFNLVDLAGSERQRDTKATGERLKEASQINKSLSALGHVINTLVEKSSGKSRHVHYRDSKLTFLLKDSIGGNAKTVLIATVSPADCNFGETLSTLKFAQRAKKIKNTAILNEETSGTVEALQKEVLALRQQLLQAPAPYAFPVETVEDDEENVNPNSGETSTQLLLDALRRCQAADQARDNTLRKCAALEKKLEQNEKALMNTKMVLRMRDSRIERMTKGGSDGSFEPTTSAEHAAELDAVREECNREVLKYRLACEELERRLQRSSVSPANGAASLPVGEVAWSVTDEHSFNHDVIGLVHSCQLANERLQEEFETLRDERFLEVVGFAIADARSLKQQVVDTRLEVDNARSKITELERRLVDSVAETERMKEEFERAVIACEQLSEEKDLLQSQVQGMEDEKRQQVDVQAAQLKLKKEHAAAMKDNRILMDRLRAMEASKEEYKQNCEKLESQLLQLQREMQAMQNEHAAQMQQIRNDAQDAERSMAQVVSALREELERVREESIQADAVKSAEISELQQRQATLERTLEETTNERDRAMFEIDSMREDYETIQDQNLFLMNTRSELEAALTESHTSLSEYATAAREQDQVAQALRSKLSEMEEMLHSTTGSISMERERIHALETENESLSRNLQETQAAVAAAENAREKTSHDLTQTQERARVSDEAVQQLSAEVHRLRLEVQQYAIRCEDLRQTKDEAMEEAMQLQGDLEELQSRLEVAENEKNELQRLYQECDTTIAELSQQLVEQNANSASLQLKLDAIHAAVSGNFGAITLGNDNEEMAGALQELHGRLNTLSKEVEELTVKNEELEAKLQSASAARVALEAIVREKIEAEEKIRSESRQAMEQLQGEHAREIAALKDNLFDAERRIESSFERSTSALKEIETELSTKTEIVAELEGQLQQKAADILSYETRFRQLNSKIEDLLNAQANMSQSAQEIKALRAELEQSQAALSQLEDDRAQLALQIQELQRQLVEAQEANARLSGHTNTKQKIQQHMKLKQEITQLQEANKALHDQIFELRTQLENSQHETRHYKSLVKDATLRHSLDIAEEGSSRALRERDMNTPAGSRHGKIH